MNKWMVARDLGILTALGGIIVIFGWLAGIPVLTSILPGWVTMKFTTALSFFLSGIIVIFILRYLKGDRELGKVILPVATLIILLLMTTLLASTFVGVRTGVEDLFVQEERGAVKTTTPGRPSAGTMIAFILTAIAGVITLFDIPLHKFLLSLEWIGAIVSGVGLLAVLGYLFNISELYYTIEGWSSAMAFHTALFFVMIGVSLFLLGREGFTLDKGVVEQRETQKKVQRKKVVRHNRLRSKLGLSHKQGDGQRQNDEARKR